ncbi:glycine cleavage system protein GcvH [Cellulomonas bogoriensis]|uniref:Glycine cleavage system H protein n=1 Tax=Cellulomonas bogoriensis 69B4 = DSM 16987 TaxID=1386082 RepID=A0A0A0BKL5_9CELL|nr:glycine cleavage system protein GcvH [Cellulomonas bogoriensis]KGM09068.1 glycine cleavage system protein H [Cellulomonas bogoriensis 69B4 = DSM 16987]
MTTIPADLSYTAEHEWVRQEEHVTFGITEHAAQALGELVFVELPAVGDTVTAGTVCGEVESTKSVSEIYSPVTGTVVAVNDAVVTDPHLINDDPYGKGWMLTVEATSTDGLLTAEQYRALLDA